MAHWTSSKPLEECWWGMEIWPTSPYVLCGTRKCLWSCPLNYPVGGDSGIGSRWSPVTGHSIVVLSERALFALPAVNQIKGWTLSGLPSELRWGMLSGCLLTSPWWDVSVMSTQEETLRQTQIMLEKFLSDKGRPWHPPSATGGSGQEKGSLGFLT